jgi:hypothetical protein
MNARGTPVVSVGGDAASAFYGVDLGGGNLTEVSGARVDLGVASGSSVAMSSIGRGGVSEYKARDSQILGVATSQTQASSINSSGVSQSSSSSLACCGVSICNDSFDCKNGCCQCGCGLFGKECSCGLQACCQGIVSCASGCFNGSTKLISSCCSSVGDKLKCLINSCGDLLKGCGSVLDCILKK